MYDIHDLFASDEYAKDHSSINPFRTIIADGAAIAPSSLGDVCIIEVNTETGWLCTWHHDAYNPSRKLVGYVIPMYDRDSALFWCGMEYLATAQSWNVPPTKYGHRLEWRRREKSLGL